MTVGRRIGSSLLVLWGVVTLVFAVVHLIPGDPVTALLAGAPSTPEIQQSLRHELGLDRPLPVQYISYLGGIVTGDFGTSLVTARPVLEVIGEQLPATLQLTVAAASLAIVGGAVAGAAAAAASGGWADRLLRGIHLIGVSMPGFWIGILLIALFSFTLGWVPATGQGGLDRLVLPAITLALPAFAVISQLVREGMVEALAEPYTTTARAKGLRHRTIVFVHVLRNAAIPAITVAGVQLGTMLAGAVVVETVFARQGIGRVVLAAINAKDFPVVQGAVLVAAVGYVVINAAVDVLVAVIDPRIRRPVAG